MVIAEIRLRALPEKQREFVQTIHDLVGLTLNAKGCLGCRFYQDLDAKDVFAIVEKWDKRKNLENYLRSDNFSILLGTRTLLREPHDIEFNTASILPTDEVIRAARREC